MSIEIFRTMDEVRFTLERAREEASDLGLKGFGVAHLLSPRGELMDVVPFVNLITNAGDLYYATRGVAGVSPASVADATKMTGMKLGTGTTAVGKSATGAANIESGTYISGSNVAFNTSYPQVTAVGTNAGYYAVYQCVWPGSGGLSNANINEVVIVNDSASNAYSTVANTISRAVLSSTVNKGTNDVLTITWNHKFLGSGS